MPVYVCQSGFGHTEPWRYGIQVYSIPFPIDEDLNREKTKGGGRDMVIASTSWSGSPHPTSTPGDDHLNDAPSSENVPQRAPSTVVATVMTGRPIRRVRHAEIVLVDDVCIAFDRYWLRLRWPGHKGGFAGYIAMDKVSPSKRNGGITSINFSRFDVADDRYILDDNEDESPEERETSSMPPSEPIESGFMTCLRTGLDFKSSHALKLLALYDDGLAPAVAMTPFNTEAVFCRICREGLHDDADEEQPAVAEDDRDDVRDSNVIGDSRVVAADPSIANIQFGQNIRSQSKTGPVQPHPVYSVNTEALQNPLLAPCECSGSMAFVHYLCVEQWRCRSRHPEARNGLNCETCGTPYSLPPPSERPAPVDQEDWLEAMPPHVMQALRQPHLSWQIGAAIVRRRWLRPLAPIVMSPIVALYCRARRLLKKRGVARRRWACSLCRRRARWKCVRCLRSYYCSRQCQNVSWHIIHKHVCYKPSRLAQSVLAYGALALVLCPGIMRDPFMFDLMVLLIPITFFVMAVLGGGVALGAKKVFGIDIRGRCLELAVVVGTFFLSKISWGLVQGFFGMPERCYNVVGDAMVTTLEARPVLHLVSNAVLWPTERSYMIIDALARKSKIVQSALCTPGSDGCFAHIPRHDFYTEESYGHSCASDILLVVNIYLLAGVVFLISALWKHQDRIRRQRGGGVRANQVHRLAQARPHQD